jgi:hypothetical protein
VDPGEPSSGRSINMVQIRLRVRAKLRDGLLPRKSSPKTLGHPGNGKKCGACDEIMLMPFLMMEISADDNLSIGLHADCYIVWNEERHLT